MPNTECMKKCLRSKLVRFIGGGTIALLVSILIATGLMFPGAGTIIAILVGLGLLLFVSISQIWDCWRKC